MANFFTSDLHFGHQNIIAYTSRPYASVDEMNLDLIVRYNSVVTSDDVVYLLGEDCEVMEVVVAYRLRPLTKPLPYSLATPQDELKLVERKCRHIRQSDPDCDGKAFPYTYCPLCGEKLR